MGVRNANTPSPLTSPPFKRTAVQRASQRLPQIESGGANADA